MKRWPDERHDRLMELVKIPKLSASGIAKDLEISRGAVIGYCNRHGIELPNAGMRLQPNQHSVVQKPSERYKTMHARGMATRARNKRKKKKEGLPQIAPMEAWEAPPVPKNCVPTPFWELEHGECKFCIEPHSHRAGPEMKCCALPVVDRKSTGMAASFCEYHMNICLDDGGE